MVDIYFILTKSYGALFKRKSIPNIILSSVRIIIRYISNIVLPLYFLYSSKRNKGQRKNDRKIIVTLTSFPKRINYVWLVVECMLRQTILPDKIILWLSKEQFSSYEAIPIKLRNRVSDIFDIKLVDNDLKSHKKYYYAFNEYPDDFVITIDDDIFYPPYLIEELLSHFDEKNKYIVGRYGFEITYDTKSDINSYNKWIESDIKNQMHSFFGSGGGTLFIPSLLYKDTLNFKIASRLCPRADDVWLNAMARLSNLSVYISSKELLLPIVINNNVRLTQANVYENQNDVQIKAVINYYMDKIQVNPFRQIM